MSRGSTDGPMQPTRNRQIVGSNPTRGTDSLTTENRVAWHGSGPIWDEFVQWAKYACSPGNGSGHLVEWYWQIWQAADAAGERIRHRTALKESHGA